MRKVAHNHLPYWWCLGPFQIWGYLVGSAGNPSVQKHVWVICSRDCIWKSQICTLLTCNLLTYGFNSTIPSLPVARLFPRGLPRLFASFRRSDLNSFRVAPRGPLCHTRPKFGSHMAPSCWSTLSFVCLPLSSLSISILRCSAHAAPTRFGGLMRASRLSWVEERRVLLVALDPCL
jgi:hypothetical protein